MTATLQERLDSIIAGDPDGFLQACTNSDKAQQIIDDLGGDEAAAAVVLKRILEYGGNVSMPNKKTGKPSIVGRDDEIRKWLAQALAPAEIAERVGVALSRVYYLLHQADPNWKATLKAAQKAALKVTEAEAAAELAQKRAEMVDHIDCGNPFDDLDLNDEIVVRCKATALPVDVTISDIFEHGKPHHVTLELHGHCSLCLHHASLVRLVKLFSTGTLEIVEWLCDRCKPIAASIKVKAELERAERESQ